MVDAWILLTDQVHTGRPLDCGHGPNLGEVGPLTEAALEPLADRPTASSRKLATLGALHVSDSFTDYLLAHLAVDRWLAVILVLYVVLMLPLIPRWTDNAAYLAAFTNDEPFITQQLDGMTVNPYGNPSNYLEKQNAAEIPSYWLRYRYYNLIYYGGTYLDVGYAFFQPLKSAGLPTFPTAPIILRSITFIAGLLSLMLLYNFARRHLGIGAALVATALVMTDVQFIFLAKFIHPDMLQFFLTLLALIVAVRLASFGDLKSTVAIGVVLGLIQGTKSGVPFLLPMVAIALAWGVLKPRRDANISGRADAPLVQVGSLIASIALKAFLMGSAAIVAFVATTPYLLFDPYYLTTTKAAFAILSGTSPLVPITFGSWYTTIAAYLGWPLLSLIAAGAAVFLARLFTGRVNAGVGFAVVLGASNLLWFTGVGRFWVVLYYLLPVLFAAGLCIGMLVQEVAGWLVKVQTPRFAAVRRPLAVALTVTVVLAVGCGGTRIPNLSETVAAGVNPDRTPQVRLNTWAVANVPHGSRILFDDEAYFDPALFPDQSTNANVIRYLDLYRQQPDYFVLTDYPNGVNWINVKRATQHFEVLNDDPYSVRLYQDLIDHSPAAYQPGPTPVPGVTLLAVSGLPWLDKLDQPAWFSFFDGVYRRVDPSYGGVQAALSTGHRLLLYQADPTFYATEIAGINVGRFNPISSRPTAGSRSDYAFDGSGQTWRADGQGAGLNGAYIGVDYGPGRSVAVREVQVKWVAKSWLPGHLLVQSSDDGRVWMTAGTYAPFAPAEVGDAPGTKRWWANYDLPPSGSHRFWRVAAADMAADHFFGLDELVFRRTQSQ